MMEVSCRSFEFANKLENGYTVVEDGKHVKAYLDAQLPEYQTKHAAGADFFCAEEVVIPSVWKQLFDVMKSMCLSDTGIEIKPTLVHTGIKANMEPDEYLEIVNRSSGPKKMGLILANSVGIIDADYYSNKDNDGEIGFLFYNIGFKDKIIKVGDRIGQGIFHKFLRPYDETKGLHIKDAVRTGGFGSTDISEKYEYGNVDTTPAEKAE